MNDRAEKQFFRPDVARDVDDELTFHLEMRQRELVERGVPPADARERVARRFGNLAAVARECRAIDEAWYREQRRASMWMDLRQDVTYAWRMLRKAPAFTTIAVLTLAVGIGATTAIFTLANWALLRPVPGVERPDDVQQIWTGARPGGTSFSPGWVSYPNLQDISPRLQSIALAGQQFASFNVGQGASGARPVSGAFVTASYFDVLGVRMRAGRPFSAAEDTPGNPAHVMVISERFARASFADPQAALGRVLQVNGIPCTVIGVTAGGFAGTDRMGGADVWMPGAATPVINHMTNRRYDDRRAGGYFQFVARLKNGATWPQADAELRSMAAWLASEYPQENAKFARTTGFHLMGPIGANPLGRPRVMTMTLLMLGVSALVLLIACSNVASLLMMRGVGRSGEVAVRKALGAARLRLIRQHLTEGVLLWAFGGGLALLIVWAALRSANGAALLGMRGRVGEGVPMDWRVILFAAAVSLIVGLVFSVAPALRAVRVEAAEMMRQGAPSSTPRNLRVGTSLTVLQLALSLTLVVGALLLAATIRHLSKVDLGFDARQLYTFSVRPGSVGYDPVRSATYREEFARQLARVPGVEQVAVSIRAPFVGSTMTTTLKKEQAGEVVQPYATELLSANYFDTLRIPLRRGRLFSQDDLGMAGSQARPVVIVSELLARELFGTADPVGRMIEYKTIGRVGKRYEIIGVVGDVRADSLTAAPQPMLYEPAALNVPVRPEGTFIVRASEGRDIAGAVRQIAAALDPALPVVLPMPMAEAIAVARAEWDVLARLMTGLAAIAALLAAIGLYGVIAFGVASRRREFGIRLALGAAPSRVMALVLRRTAIIAAGGLLLGAGGAYALARVLSSRLFGITPFDPWIWTLAALTFVVLALAASWIPARRAVSVDVTHSLRAL